MNDNEILLQLKEILSCIPLDKQVEVLANYMLQEGVSCFHGAASLSFDPQDIAKTVLNYRLEHGETLEGALALQGLMMLGWTEQKRA